MRRMKQFLVWFHGVLYEHDEGGVHIFTRVHLLALNLQLEQIKWDVGINLTAISHFKVSQSPAPFLSYFIFCELRARFEEDGTHGISCGVSCLKLTLNETQGKISSWYHKNCNANIILQQDSLLLARANEVLCMVTLRAFWKMCLFN